ncbi:glycoside hydrolase family 2 protein [Candidatus Cyanaurora vandensis]|uniref:glycoside hydrolase family 2 protein n=1 Tax=Candidatus Cyanaurora vandensis TaxID=2714958 RepID=UPI00257C3D14|nr:glycoside hydrolase family 2 TIM barrel-domain containing protein [Candidatus Cyanaurora vandensis]
MKSLGKAFGPQDIATAVGAYPRPQLVRADWISLNGPWRFAFEETGLQSPDQIEWSHQIQVPFAPETPASGIGETGFHQYCWYEREFTLVPPAGRVLLHFGAVDYRAQVWVNGKFVTEHEGGYTPFSVDITQVLDPGGQQRVTVCAEDEPHDLAKPRGKQDWQLNPHSIWYPRTSGIWQTVWYECVAPTYLDRIRWMPHFERWEIGFEASLAGERQEGLQLKVRLTVGNQLLVNDCYEVINSEVHRRIALSDPGIDDYRNELLWSPERPTLINAELQLWQGHQLLDVVRSYTAMRTVGVQRDRFMLNGRPYYLRLVLDQGYWPETFMTAPSDEHLRQDVELAKQMGFNGVRKHQKIEDPRYLYWADKLGLMVWEEMPSAYRFTPKAVTRMTREWTEVIERDLSHPCVVVWVPFNESWGVPDLTATPAHRDYVQALYYLTKTLDPTRPVIGNDGWESASTDILGIHDYDNNARHLAHRYGPEMKLTDLFDRERPGGRLLTLDGYAHRGQPLMLTEFGGICYAPNPEHHVWGYAHSQNHAEFQTNYTALLWAVNHSGVLSGFCYTQFADTFQEANGLLYADRTPKLPLNVIASATLGRGSESDLEAILHHKLAQGNDALPAVAQTGWSSTDPVQPLPHCGGTYGT